MYLNSLIPNYTDPSSYDTNPKAQKEINKDAFLSLLVAQLKNQDPLNPMESTEFTAQLAQFSSLEQLFNINENLKTLSQEKAGQTAKDLIDYIGKEITWTDNTLVIKDGEVTGGAYKLTERGDVILSIFNTAGTEIRTLYNGDQQAGEYDIRFDGRDQKGQSLPDGTYSFVVKAFTKNGAPMDVTTSLKGKVTAVTYKNETPYLVVGEHVIRPEGVREIRMTETL